MPTKLENSIVAIGLEKVSFHCSPKGGQYQRMFQLPYIVLISHASKAMLKIHQGFNCMWTENFQMFKLELEKAEEPELKLTTSIGS